MLRLALSMAKLEALRLLMGDVEEKRQARW